MQVETHGHQLEVTPALREHVETKFQKLARHFDRPLDVRTQLRVDKPHHKAEATMRIAGKALHADASAADMYVAIDQLADKLDRLLVKHRKKVVDHHRGENPARDGTFG
ncbi:MULTISPECIES: ribosome-associated translation inhibitor RaiA [Luteimonas]|uniref:Ribosome hibernation promoting factor n=1 Tax=Luteimonas chenhongjianii TaxID=2006110 RepID=A0A290XGL7_9GAMM|nr:MULTISPECIES: ribosome-associated translation inhibitor RaiA [Luteimonas]ATD68295.1 ribosomal subunit interface protein [Luteimonas chenhongjianii]RPD88024.1 ribosome-associated translation inhibitor RaiA [Luteimonas sp. 100069]